MTTIQDRAAVVAADLSPTDKIPVHRTGQPGGNSITLANFSQYLNGSVAIATNNPVANMVGDGVTDNLSIWNTLAAAYTNIFIPAGDYLFSGPMEIPIRHTVLGAGHHTLAANGGTLIRGTSGQTCVIHINTGGDTEVNFGNVCIVGAADVGLLTGDSADCVESYIHDIRIAGTFNIGFSFRLTFGCHLRNLFVVGSATIADACFVTKGAFNANTCDNWYTSNTCPVNFRIEDDGNGDTFNNMTAQGGDIGLYLKKGHSLTFNGFYSEACEKSVEIGVAGDTVTGITFNSGLFSGSAAGIACVDIVDARNIVFNAPKFELFNSYADVTVTPSGGGGSGAVLRARVNATGEVHSVIIVRPGTGYTSAPSIGFSGSGSGATATSGVGGGAITSVTVTAPGSGYTSNGACIASVRYHNCGRVVLIAPSTNEAATNPASYSTILRTSGAASSSRVTIVSGVSSRNVTTAATSDMRGAQGYGYQHYVEELDSTGTEVRWSYVPPAA